MSNAHRKDGRRSATRQTPNANGLPDYANSHVVRTARALIGITPVQLAAHIGANPQPQARAVTDRPVQSFEDLGQALHVIIGWYQDNLGTGAARGDALARGTMSLDEVVRQYIALRSQWENREAERLAAQMSESSCGGGDARVKAQRASAAAPAEYPARRRALLVDDSADILVTVGSFLETFGFDVVSASNADLALGILASGPAVDLLVTDHAMPGMTGRDLAAQASQTHPNLRVLIITGYPDAKELGVLPPRVMLLAKPFRRAELSARIRLLLESETHVHA